MIEVIFTLDYEIYGNGDGNLNELVLEPTRRLVELLSRYNAKCVIFVEALEFWKIKALHSDSQIHLVEKQIRDLFLQGNEIGLHLHPQWANGSFSNGRWDLDYAEYNLCTLSFRRISNIVDQSVVYLKSLTQEENYVPLSFRAGNWLFQPTQPLSNILFQHGIRIDSSVFKGGLIREYGIDYRILNNGSGYHWQFRDEVTKADSSGGMIEIPIFTTSVPFWRMIKYKRFKAQGLSTKHKKNRSKTLTSIANKLRFLYPRKFDFCRMTSQEMLQTMNKIIADDVKSPDLFKPIVLIGHSKDFMNLDDLNSFLGFLKRKSISITTFEDVYRTLGANTQNKGKLPD